MKTSTDTDRVPDFKMLAEFEADSEKARTELARKLHDELGGFLVAAVMDTAWAEQNLESIEDARARLKRARKSLSAAVDLKRGIIEKLRPTLLDTFGLLAALRWKHKHICEDALLQHSEDLPVDEPAFTAAASIALFRIAQEGLSLAVRQAGAGSVHLGLDMSDGMMNLNIGHGGRYARTELAADVLSWWLLNNRVRALGGTFRVSESAKSGVNMTASIPLRNLVDDNSSVARQPPTPA